MPVFVVLTFHLPPILSATQLRGGTSSIFWRGATCRDTCAVGNSRDAQMCVFANLASRLLSILFAARAKGQYEKYFSGGGRLWRQLRREDLSRSATARFCVSVLTLPFHFVCGPGQMRRK